MSARRRSGWRGQAVGIAVLALAGVGLWFGATWTDDDGRTLFRTLESEGPGDSVAAVPVPEGRVRVAVLNAGGVSGMAGEARDELRDAGFDVVEVGNAPRFGQEASAVVLRSGDADMAVAVARLLGIEDVRIEADTTLLVEVTVLLGSSWKNREARSAAAAEGVPQ